jgi:GST-like protein
MITFHTWATPNGSKVAAMLEECGLPYALRPVNLPRGEQKAPAFLALNPNGKIPVIVDDDGPDRDRFVLSESGAILVYLAEKTGRLLPARGAARHRALEWVMFQMAAVGPMFGQVHHFRASAPDDAYALARFEGESRRLLGVLDGRLAGSAYLAGDDYTIADVCTWPWLRSWQTTIQQDLAGFDHVARWYAELAARPAMAKAVAIYDRLRAAAIPA